MFIIILSSYYVTVVYLLSVAHSIVAAAVSLCCSLIFHQHFSKHGYGMLLYTEYVYQIVALSMSQNLNYNSSIRSKIYEHTYRYVIYVLLGSQCIKQKNSAK